MLEGRGIQSNPKKEKTMNRRQFFSSLGSLCLVLMLSTPSFAAEITLRYVEQNTQMAWSSIHCVEPWVKKVEEATKGKVKIEVFWGQTLVKGPDHFNAIKNGVVDMGWCFHWYLPEMTPLSDVITLPGLPFKTGEKAGEGLGKF